MKDRNYRYFMGDFETTVYKGQTHTEVWVSAVVEFYTEDVKILHSIADTFNYLRSLKQNVCVYYHNLKFDGQFWMSYLIKNLGYKQAIIKLSDKLNDLDWQKQNEMKNKTFSYMISNMGQWYKIIIKVDGHYIELRDSLKLLPFSVKRIGESFGTKHKKLDMKYEGFRYAGCNITDEEKEYIANDVLVVKEALEIMFDEGHKKLTIGGNCLEEFKKTQGDYKVYSDLYPDLYAQELDEILYGAPNVGEYIRKSYRGGWCYLAKGKENQIKTNGTTADVNSLYPSMMSSESGNYYPYGIPKFWKGDYIPDEALKGYYFVRVKTRFYIKHNKLPFIQIKNTLMYLGNECLESSDIYDEKNDRYYPYYKDKNGNIKDTRIIMTLTMTDFKLLKDHYELVDFEILDGCYFNKTIGLFDRYIEKYKKIKLENKGAKRELAKLFLNNLYGKMATNTNSSFKVAFEDEDGSIAYTTVPQYNKKGGYIPIGSAITSYARNFTIRSAQENYYGPDKRGFIYADTDSIHCDLLPNEIKGIKVHDKNFCCWKLESSWDVGLFVRQKTYIEHVVKEDLQDIDNPYYNVKCAGMPERCKKLFIDSITTGAKEDENYTEDEIKFLENKRELTDFKIGLVIPSKLMPKRISGGVVLIDTTYEMR